MRALTTTVLIALFLQLVFACPTFAGTKEENRAEKIRAEVAKLGIGPDAKIELKLVNGNRLKGHVAESGPDQFVVVRSGTLERIPVSYNSVKQVKGNNLSTGVKILIGVGLLVVFLVWLDHELGKS